MKIIKILLFVYFNFLLLSTVQAFTDKEDKGAQSTGREDLSFLNAKNSNFKKGKDALKQALKLQSKKKNIKATKRFNDSLEYFLLAYEDYPDNVEILSYLALTYNKVGDLFMAEIYYLEGLTIDPKNNSINEKLGKLYFETKRIDFARERLKVLKFCNCKEYLNLKNIIINY